MLIMFAACSSDDIPEVTKSVEDTEISTKQYKVEFPLIGDTVALKKEQGYGSRSKPVLNDVYLIANYDQDVSLRKRLKINVYTQTSNTTGELNGIIAFYINKTKSGNVAISNGSQSIVVSSNERCMISSVPDNSVSLSLRENQTPNGKSAYVQYGDNLFRSHRLFFSYEKSYSSESFVIDVETDDKYTAKIDNSKDYLLFQKGFFNNEPLTLVLDRYTISLVANIALVDWENGIFGSTKLQEVTERDFKKFMKGTQLSDWSVRPFMSGAPSTFDLFQNIATPPKGNSLISLFESPATFSATEIAKRDVHDSFLNLLGSVKVVGAVRTGDEGEVFIFPMTKTEDKDKPEIENSAIYYSFHCSNTDPVVYGTQYHYHADMTFRVPFNDLGIEKLEPNTKYEILTVIAIWDFQRIMRTDLSLNDSRSRTLSDAVWGDCIDIPYKVIIRKIE